MREIVNGIRYVARNGIPWAEMPHNLPPKSAVYYYFATWRDDGTDEKIHDLLRWQVREKAGRSADPTASALDMQSLHAAVNVPAATTGRDASKRVRAGSGARSRRDRADHRGGGDRRVSDGQRDR